MNNPTCFRCQKKDPYFFGDWISISKSSLKVYYCFGCQHLCEQCGLHSGEYLVSHLHQEINVCESCHQKRK